MQQPENSFEMPVKKKKKKKNSKKIILLNFIFYLRKGFSRIVSHTAIGVLKLKSPNLFLRRIEFLENKIKNTFSLANWNPSMLEF